MNFKLTVLLLLFHSCVVIMVSCENDSDQKEVNAYNHKQFPKISQARDGEEITQVEDLETVLLDEISLQNFPIQEDGYIKRINIATSISRKHCKKFGLLLLGWNRIPDVSKTVDQNQDIPCEIILFKWLNMKGANYDERITFRTLINKIYKLDEEFENGYNELANKIKDTVKIHKTMDTDHVPSLVRSYSAKLSKKYQKDSVIDNLQWIPKMLDRKIKFVDLELKEGNNDSLTLDNALYNIQDGMRILFTGRPGVGKTTITRYLSKYMPKFKHFFLIIKLHLGALSEPINDLDTLLEIHRNICSIPFHLEDIKCIANFIQMTNGKSICFLLDGYDEYISSRHGSYINGIVLGEKLADSVVIMTSRPSAVREIQNLFQRKIEMIGFTDSSIYAYLRQLELPDAQNKTIYQYLNKHPSIWQMCYLPLHLSMLVYIATDSDALELVNTETELYYYLLALTIKHYEMRHNRTVESLKECFGDSSTQTGTCYILRSISKIAYDGLMNGTQMFTSSSLSMLSKVANISAEIEALSLFKIETSLNKDGTKVFKYWYSHPTFQEFFAAFYLTTLPKELQLEYLNNVYHLRIHDVHKYYFGLIRSMSKYDDETTLIMFLTFAKQFFDSHNFLNFYLMKLAHETGHDSQYINYLRAMGIISQNNSVHVYLHRFDRYHCWYLGQIIAQIPLNELNVQIDTLLEVKSCISSIISYLNNDPSFSGDVNVTKLVITLKRLFYFNKDHLFYNKEFFEIASVNFKSTVAFISIFQRNLQHLKLLYVINQTDSILQLGETLMSFNVLQSLALQVDISIIKGGYLEKILQNLTHLRHLELTLLNNYNKTISDCMLELENLKQLQSLELDFYNLGDISAAAQLSGLKFMTNLEILFIHLHSYQFRNYSTEKLLGIQEVHKIKNLTLDLYICENSSSTHANIKEVCKALGSLRLLLVNLSLSINFSRSAIWDHVSVTELADAVGNLIQLRELNLYFNWNTTVNNTIDKTVLALTDKLKYLHNLHTLKLALTYCGNYENILRLFPSFVQLQNFYLKCNKVPNDIKKLLNELKSLKLLKQLVLCQNSIRDDDMKPLTGALKEMNYLQILDLSQNKIGDYGMKLLVEVLKETNNLHTLDLSRNKIGDDGIKSLAELFNYPQQRLFNLKVLILKDNIYSKDGAKFLTEKLHAIKFNFSTVTIDFSDKILFETLQQKLLETSMNSSQLTLGQLHPYRYYYCWIFTIILGLAVLIGMWLFLSAEWNFQNSNNLALYAHKFDCSGAVKNIRKYYDELTYLPIDSMLGKLYAKEVITLREKEWIGTFHLKNKKMECLLDAIIIPSLKSKHTMKLKGFLEVMEESDDRLLNAMAKNLGDSKLIP